MFNYMYKSIEMLEGRKRKAKISVARRSLWQPKFTHPTSKHLSTLHCEKTALMWKRYLPGGREGGKTKQQAIYTLRAKHMALSLKLLLAHPTYQIDCWPPLA